METRAQRGAQYAGVSVPASSAGFGQAFCEVAKHFFVFRSQHWIPFVTAGQLFWQSVSNEHVATHCLSAAGGVVVDAVLGGGSFVSSRGAGSVGVFSASTDVSEVAQATRIPAIARDGRIRLACFTAAEHPPPRWKTRVTRASQKPFFLNQNTGFRPDSSNASMEMELRSSSAPDRGFLAPFVRILTPFFAGKRALGVLIALGVVVFLPAITAPFFLDDFLHVAMVEGEFPGRRSAFDFYDFVADDNRAEMLERGLLPWWTHPALRIRFFRPLASVLVWFDHALFGHHALPMHLHSVLWWALAVLVVHRLFAQTFARRTSLIATAVFALAPCHWLPLAWLANRETLLAITFGVSGLLVVRRPLLAALAFALALAGGGEYALAFGGYVLAWSLVSRDVPRASRAAALASFAVPAATYLAVRTRLGYGAVGSGFYTDPLREPLSFASKVPWRGVVLLVESWLTFDASSFTPGSQRWLLVVLLLGAALLCVPPLVRAVRALEPARKTKATWLVLGSVLSLSPVLAVVPAMRLLGICTIGVALAVALVLEQAWFHDRDVARTREVELAWVAALVLGYAHLVHGPGTSFTLALRHRKEASKFVDGAAWLRARAPDTAEARVGIVRGMSLTFFTPFAIDPKGRTPAKWCLLAHSGHTLAVRRAEKVLELSSSEDRGLFPVGDGNLFRSEEAALKVGDEVKNGCVRAKILEVGPRGPRSVRLTLDDPSALTWVEDDYDGWKTVELPAVGFGAPFDP